MSMSKKLLRERKQLRVVRKIKQKKLVREIGKLEREKKKNNGKSPAFIPTPV